jgi:hypothetical protein
MEYVSQIVTARDAGQSIPVDFLGTAMDINDPLPKSLVTLLDQKLCSHDPRTNLLEYGCWTKVVE